MCSEVLQFEPNQIVKKTPYATVAYGRCHTCDTSVFTVSLSNEGGRTGDNEEQMTSVSLMTDLMHDEVEALWGTSSFTEDDVLDVHALVRGSLEEMLLKK